MPQNLTDRRPEGKPRAAGDALSIIVEAQLRRSGHYDLRQLEVDERDGHVHLSGRVRTYYAKQLAQTIALSVEGVSTVENEVVVE